MEIFGPQNLSADGTEAAFPDVVGEALGAEDVPAHGGEEIVAFLLQVQLGIQANAASHCSRSVGGSS